MLCDVGHHMSRRAGAVQHNGLSVLQQRGGKLRDFPLFGYVFGHSAVEGHELTARGWKSAFTFSKAASSSIRTIQGIARIPENFGRVVNTVFTDDGIEFTGCSGITVSAKVDWKFVK
jgi:hypothetical protein